MNEAPNSKVKFAAVFNCTPFVSKNSVLDVYHSQEGMNEDVEDNEDVLKCEIVGLFRDGVNLWEALNELIFFAVDDYTRLRWILDITISQSVLDYKNAFELFRSRLDENEMIAIRKDDSIWVLRPIP